MVALTASMPPKRIMAGVCVVSCHVMFSILNEFSMILSLVCYISKHCAVAEYILV